MNKSEIQWSPALHQYLLSSLREPPVLNRLREETSRDQNAVMQIPPEQGQLLSFLIKVLGARKTLEIGTYTGYSTLCVALALPPDGQVVACDINAHWTSIARRYWKEAGVAHKIDLRMGPAVHTLEALIENGASDSFDFAFIDADKIGYDRYYEQSLSLVRPGGVIAIDNVFLFGTVADPGLLDTDRGLGIRHADAEVIRNLSRKIKDDPRVDETMLPIADGLTLVRKVTRSD